MTSIYPANSHEHQSFESLSAELIVRNTQKIFFFETIYYGHLDKDNFLVHKIIMKQLRSLFKSSKKYEKLC